MLTPGLSSSSRSAHWRSWTCLPAPRSLPTRCPLAAVSATSPVDAGGAHQGEGEVAARRPERDGAARRPAERDRDAVEASRDRFAFLADVSRCLAESLDYETTLATVAGM